jgi:uncharacterized membrane protein
VSIEEPKATVARVRHFIRTNLLAGLLFLTPLVATFYLLKILINWVDGILLILPAPIRPENFLPFRIPGLGVIMALLIILGTGVLVRNYIGRKLVTMWEDALSHIPLVSKFYWGIKQLIETIAGGSGKEFKKVVLIEFPREGVYSLGYVTGVAVGEIQEKTRKRVLNIYVPTTPNPTSGYYLIVPEDEVVPLDMSVEDSFKLLISGGILHPESNQLRSNKLTSKGGTS